MPLNAAGLVSNSGRPGEARGGPGRPGEARGGMYEPRYSAGRITKAQGRHGHSSSCVCERRRADRRTLRGGGAFRVARDPTSRLCPHVPQPQRLIISWSREHPLARASGARLAPVIFP
jgi:hypothetical protein